MVQPRRTLYTRRMANTVNANVEASPALAHAAMLSALIGGRALTARELARAGHMSVETARDHLSTLEQAGLLTQRRQGPHRYFQVANTASARDLIDTLGTARRTPAHVVTGPKEPAMRRARVCYGHLAGPRAVRIFDCLARRAFVTPDGDDLHLTSAGEAFFSDFGIDLAATRSARHPLCKTCLDWSERRSHLAGPLGTALLNRITTLGWAARDPDSRLITFTQSGETKLDALFAV